MILKNVELHWTKLDPSNPTLGFSGDKPQWSVQLRTRSKDQSAEWKKVGLNVRVDDDEGGIFYKVTVMKEAKKKDGSDDKPVRVVGRDNFPFENLTGIGNGTTANVKLRVFEYNFKGKEGVGVRLDAIQIVDLIEYESKSGEDFEALDESFASDKASDEDLF